MTARRLWTRDELLLAIDLYCLTPFGRLHNRNPQIVCLAESLGRTPSALALKMVNFASIDPTIDRTGMKNHSKLDATIWQEIFQDWSSLERKVELAMSNLGIQDRGVADGKRRREKTESTGTRKTRLGQRTFHNMVFASYNFSCAITSVSDPRLLIASHIIPWSVNEKERLNPSNGICLNALHDKAFDKGLITFDSGFCLVLSGDIKASPQTYGRGFFKQYEGQKMKLPDRFLPSLEFLEYHQSKIFIG